MSRRIFYTHDNGLHEMRLKLSQVKNHASIIQLMAGMPYGINGFHCYIIYMTDDTIIDAFLKTAKTIAVIGASADPSRSSNGVMGALQRSGYRCIPVNPNESEILGETCYPDLASIPADIDIDIVDVFRRAEFTPAIAQEAVDRRAKCLWLQLGVVNDDAMKIAGDAGLLTVQDECLAVVVRTLR